jgi:hypothetical protein
MGRIIFQVLETRDLNRNVTTIVNIAPKEVQFINSKENIPTDLESSCRICFMGIEEEEDPLMSVCKCRGSCQYVHIYCLKKWIEHQKVMTTNSKYISSFNNNKLTCDLCHEILPWTISVDKTIHTLVDFPKPCDEPYILLLERFNLKESSRVVHLITPKDTSLIKIGRDPSDHLTLSDRSVSRHHAVLDLDNQYGFNIADNDSKYGTLIKLDEAIDFVEYPSLMFVYKAFAIHVERKTDHQIQNYEVSSKIEEEEKEKEQEEEEKYNDIIVDCREIVSENVDFDKFREDIMGMFC